MTRGKTDPVTIGKVTLQYGGAARRKAARVSRFVSREVYLHNREATVATTAEHFGWSDTTARFYLRLAEELGLVFRESFGRRHLWFPRPQGPV